jgi:anti-sigma-K factor RskA
MTRYTPEPPDHETYEELAAGWALHALEPDDEARFVAHLPGCARCQQAVADFSGALATLAYATPESEPPPSLGERIRAEVARDLAASAGAPDRRRADTGLGFRPGAHRGQAEPRRTSAQPIPMTRPTPPRERHVPGRSIRWLAAAAAVLAIVLGAGNVVQYLQSRAADERSATAERRARTEADRRAELLRQLAQPGTKVTKLVADGKPVGYVFVRDGKVQVLTDGLPRNDTNTQTYVLWAVSQNGEAKPMAAFDVTRADIDLRGAGRLPSEAGGIKAFAVSLEPGRQPPAQPTKVVAKGAVES